MDVCEHEQREHAGGYRNRHAVLQDSCACDHAGDAQCSARVVAPSGVRSEPGNEQRAGSHPPRRVERRDGAHPVMALVAAVKLAVY
eukprot:scaffold32631_cov36-Tisochrysis_lutea.AAC.4